MRNKDIQTARFSGQPAYAPPLPGPEPKLSGYSVSNELSVTFRETPRLGDILDRLVAAGATDLGNVTFLLSDASKALDQARDAAFADARRKAELYARLWSQARRRRFVTEHGANVTPPPVPTLRASNASLAAVPIASGQDRLQSIASVSTRPIHRASTRTTASAWALATPASSNLIACLRLGAASSCLTVSSSPGPDQDCGTRFVGSRRG